MISVIRDVIGGPQVPPGGACKWVFSQANISNMHYGIVRAGDAVTFGRLPVD